MTNKQYKIYKAVHKHRTLPEILSKTGISNYLALQDEAGVGMLDFSDNAMNAHTVVTLSSHAAEAMEERQRTSWKEIRNWISFVLAVWGAITGTIAVFWQ